MMGAVRTTVDHAIGDDSVSNHATLAVSAGRREAMDGALEAVEDVLLPVVRDHERLVVVIPAHFACSHEVVRFECPDELHGSGHYGCESFIRV